MHIRLASLMDSAVSGPRSMRSVAPRRPERSGVHFIRRARRVARILDADGATMVRGQAKDCVCQVERVVRVAEA